MKTGNNHKHGDASTAFYKRWSGIKARCGKGRYKHVTVCEQWNDYLNFKADMYDSFVKHKDEHGERNTTIDRIDNNKGYFPENCRWATYEVQIRNRTISVSLTVDGETMYIPEWSEKTGLSQEIINSRKYKGWSDDRIINETVRDHFARVEVTCKWCGKKVEKHESVIRRHQNTFCSGVCRTTHQWSLRKAQIT